ncbi:NAD(P)+ transhydrogenase beta chain [Agrobacterium deltaense]
MKAKPSYRMSKRQIWISFWLAWLVILLLVWKGVNGSPEAVALAGTVVPSMMVMIAALLGIHRGFGSVDFAMTQPETSPASYPPPSPFSAPASPVEPSPPSLGYDPRDQPGPVSEFSR